MKKCQQRRHSIGHLRATKIHCKDLRRAKLRTLKAGGETGYMTHDEQDRRKYNMALLGEVAFYEPAPPWQQETAKKIVAGLTEQPTLEQLDTIMEDRGLGGRPPVHYL